MTWRERIQAARERGHFTPDDIIDATSSWLTCAVGEQRERYGADVIHVHAFAPFDPLLLSLGGTETGGFGWAVQRNQFNLAESLLDAIEDRALHLKRTHGEETA